VSRRDRPKKKSSSSKREPPRSATDDDARAESVRRKREASERGSSSAERGAHDGSERGEERGTREGSESDASERAGAKETSNDPRIEHATHRDPSTHGWLDDALVLIAAVLAFARSVPNDLVRGWDDGRFLVDFAPVQSISWDHLVAIFREPHFEAYHPLHLLSYWLDVPFAGAHGPTLHATSLALFAGALLLVRRVFRALGLGRSAALVATLAYGLHPVNVEAVAWATGRKEIVALLFASGAILMHLRSTSPFSGAAWGSRVLYVLAALAKTTVLPLPIVLVLIDVFLRPTSPDHGAHSTSRASRVGRAFFAQLPTLAIGLALGMLVLSIWQSSEMVRPPLDGFGPVALVASTITHHLGHALAPFGSSPVYPIHRDASAFGALDYLGPLALAIAMLVPSPRARFSILAFLVLLLPVSNLVPLYFEVQDRYLALPLLPLAFGLGAFVDHSSSASTSKPIGPASATSRALRALPSPRAVIALAYVALLATLTYRYSTAWANDGTLWRHATRAQPQADYAWLKLGETLRDEALAADPTRDDTRLTFDRSIHAYDRAIRIAPTLVIPHVARLRAMTHRDELVHAIEPSRAAELATRFGRAQANAEALKELASEMLELGYHDAALVPLARALDLDPIAPERLEHAARVQLESGHEWLARFYVSRLPGPPIDPALAALR
jgi:tetratricopeptide (TPR) repeat protein